MCQQVINESGSVSRGGIYTRSVPHIAEGAIAMASVTATETGPIVRTQQGRLRGSMAEGAAVFKGVPYAAPPFGANRLLPPRRVAPWDGVRDALSYGSKAPQLPYPPPLDVLIPEPVAAGEDCLNLNIWSPGLGSSGQPVMVWIPGGAFEHGTGSSPCYDGSRFARDGVVCVTINYRVGAEGFLYLGDATANLGLLDQLAALEWVHDNIAMFGGDADNVTIFGQSAGAMSVGTLLSLPRARGLFRRAIAQSGAAHQVIPAAAAELVAARLADALGVSATRAAIAAVPVDRVLLAQAHLASELMTNPDPERWGSDVVMSQMPWQPVIDGDIIPSRPIDALRDGVGADIDLMVGATTDEWRMFLVPSGAIDAIPDQVLAATVESYGLPVEATLARYRDMHPRASDGDLFASILGDWYVGIPVLRLADAHASSASAATFVYEFAWRSPQYGGRLGACHTLDVAFVFDTLGNATEPLMGANPPQALADTIHAAWVAFARDGKCGWPSYDLGRRATMRFDLVSEVVDDPWSATRRTWEEAR